MSDDIVGEHAGTVELEARRLRQAGSYRIRVAQEDLNFRVLEVEQPAPLGRDILAAAGLDPRDGFSVFGILPSGDFEDVRLDERFDLDLRGAERFVVFRSDRTFKLWLDGAEVSWGKPSITGTALYTLGRVDAEHAIYLEIPGQNRLIEQSALIDLTGASVERFVSGPRPIEPVDIIVNARQYRVPDRSVSFEQVVQLAFPGPHGPTIVFSMTFRHAQSVPHGGELGPGGIVLVRNGTIFNVTRTDKS